jgi:site-specific DNA recombinase
MLTRSQTEQLEQELQHIVSESKKLDIRTKIENTLDSMENLANLYQQGDLMAKKTIGCLIFPQKVEFDGKSFQTPKMNIVDQCIYQYNSELGNKKNRHKRVKSSNVGHVTKTSVSSNTFIDDLVRLSQIKQELQSSFLSNKFF